MSLNKLLVFLIVTIVSIGAAKAKDSDYIPYVIKKGDSASQVIANHSLTPLYGKAKWVEKVLELNRLTYETAKKLEPGDVIVLPISASFFSDDEFQDEVKTLKSSWTKEFIEKSIAPKTNNVTVRTSYFAKDHVFNNENVRLNQNVMATVEYKRRKAFTNDKYTINPILTANVYTQSNADFESNASLVAEFTPSTLISAGFEVEDRDSLAALVFDAQYESFSTLDFIGSQFEVTRENLLWFGAGFQKTFNVSQLELFGSAAYYRTAGGEGQKVQGRVGAFFKRHYMLDLFASSTTLGLNSDVFINSTGLSVGYRF